MLKKYLILQVDLCNSSQINECDFLILYFIEQWKKVNSKDIHHYRSASARKWTLDSGPHIHHVLAS